MTHINLISVSNEKKFEDLRGEIERRAKLDLMQSGQYKRATQKDFDYLIGNKGISIEDGVGNQMAINR